MKNAVIILLLATVGLLGFEVYSQVNTVRDQKLALQDLTGKLQAASTKASLDLQEKCARQARQEFNSNGWEKEQMAAFINHYDDQLNRCFWLLTNTKEATADPGQFFTSTVLSDAFEGKLYGQFMQKSEKDKKYWEVKLFMCSVTLPGERQTCKSRDEFDAAIQQYIGPNAR